MNYRKSSRRNHQYNLELRYKRGFAQYTYHRGKPTILPVGLYKEISIVLAEIIRNETDLTERLVGRQNGFHFALLFFLETVFDLFFPVACLFLDVESETSRATDGLQSLRK